MKNIASESGRIFIGLPIAVQTQQEIDELISPLRESIKEIRWTASENRHLTLAFLGTISTDDIALLLQVFAGGFTGVEPFGYELRKLGRFPGKRGRILALEGEADKHISQLHQQVLSALDDHGIAIQEKDRRFRPHITLGRIAASYKEGIAQQNVLVPIAVNQVNIYRSEKRDGKRVYSVIASAELG